MQTYLYIRGGKITIEIERDIHGEECQWPSLSVRLPALQSSLQSFNVDGTHKCSSVAAFRSLRAELTQERRLNVEGEQV